MREATQIETRSITARARAMTTMMQKNEKMESEVQQITGRLLQIIRQIEVSSAEQMDRSSQTKRRVEALTSEVGKVAVHMNSQFCAVTREMQDAAYAVSTLSTQVTHHSSQFPGLQSQLMCLYQMLESLEILLGCQKIGSAA